MSKSKEILSYLRGETKEIPDRIKNLSRKFNKKKFKKNKLKENIDVIKFNDFICS